MTEEKGLSKKAQRAQNWANKEGKAKRGNFADKKFKKPFAKTPRSGSSGGKPSFMNKKSKALAPKKSKKPKMEYKSQVITSLLKILKKLKAFTIRKMLRNIKMIEENDENYKGKETKEELEEKVELIKQVKNHDLKAIIPLLIVIDVNDRLDKYWPILETMKVTTKPEYNGLLKKLLEAITERELKINVEDAETFGEETLEPHDGLVEFLVHILTKKHTQYKATLEELEKVMAGVRVKTEKSKVKRDEKKLKLKEKIEQGEFLPKEQYQEVRKENKVKLEEETKKKEELAKAQKQLQRKLVKLIKRRHL